MKTSKNHANRESIPIAGQKKTDELEHYGMKKITPVYYQQELGYAGICSLVAVLFLMLGYFDGYIISVSLILQSQPDNYYTMYLLSFVSYPALLKFLVSPIMDTFYIKTFGKSKTYLVASSLCMASICLVSSSYIDNIITTNQAGMITLILVSINVCIMFYFMAATIWIVTLFTGIEAKTRGSLIKPLAEELGKIIFLGVFIPLNSVKWLNQYVYTQENAISEPMISHRHVFLFAGGSLLMLAGFVTFFVAEKKIKTENHVSLRVILKFVPKLLSSRNLIVLTGFFMTFECLHYLASELVELKTVHAGFSKESVAVIDMISILPTLASGIFYQRYLKFGSLVTAGYIMAAAWLVAVLGEYMLALKLEQTPGWPGAFWCYLVYRFTAKFTRPSICYLSYLVQISDAKASSTIIGIMISVYKLGHLIPRSASLCLATRIDADVIIVACMVGHLIALSSMFGVARRLDSLTPAE